MRVVFRESRLARRSLICQGQPYALGPVRLLRRVPCALFRMGKARQFDTASTAGSKQVHYGEAAARLYDDIAGDYACRLAAWICRTRWLVSGRALDVGCGTGVLMEDLGKHGWDCWGVDSAEAMVREARRRVGRSRVGLCDARRIQHRERFVLVTAFGDVVNHIGTNAGLRAFLRGARRALQPGGHLIFDTLDPRDIDQNWPSYVQYSSGHRWRLIRTGRRLGPGRGEITYEYFLHGQGERWLRHTERHRLRAWGATELNQLLKDSGLLPIKRLDAECLGALRKSTVRWLVVAQRRD
jgi:SAM-dependent methyltransferase